MNNTDMSELYVMDFMLFSLQRTSKRIGRCRGITAIHIYICVCLYMHAFTSAHEAHVKRDRFAGSKRVYELLDKPDRH